MSLVNKLFQTFHKDAKKGARITPAESYEAVRSGQAVLVDVREADELKEEGTAEPALWLPTSEIANETPKAREFVAQLPKDKVIIIYCAAGVRAGRFAEALANQGFQTANMGGFESWAKAGLPVRKI